MSFLILERAVSQFPDEFGDARRRRITVRRQLFDFHIRKFFDFSNYRHRNGGKDVSLTGIKDIQILSHKEDCKIRYPECFACLLTQS